MRDLFKDCTVDCERMPLCEVCGKTKKPIGRDAPAEQATEPTEAMKEAEKAFIDRMLSLYEVRCCKRVTQTEVNVRAFEESRK